MAGLLSPHPPAASPFIAVLCPHRRPHVSQLVLELSGRGGIRVPARPSLHLGPRRSRPRGHRPQRGPLLPVRHLPVQVAPQQKGQAGVWTHGREFVHLPTRSVPFLTSRATKTSPLLRFCKILNGFVVQAVKAKSTSCAQSPWRAPMKKTRSALWSGTCCQQTIY